MLIVLNKSILIWNIIFKIRFLECQKYDGLCHKINYLNHIRMYI